MENLSNEVVIHKNEGEVEYLQFKKLNEYSEINHCYTLRHGEINFKNSENLMKNYDIICERLGFDKKSIVKPHQTHTDKVGIVKSGNDKFSEVDGVITNKKEITLCTTSADCTTLLFYDPIKKVIGDIHSGWRGTIQKIGKKTIEKMMENYGCEPRNIICCICPHIRKCHFEVEEDVARLFLDTFSNKRELESWIVKSGMVDGKQKYHIDTVALNREMLIQMGLKRENIIDSGICTVCQSKHFHSYRTDKQESGRNGAMISLRA